MFGNYLIFQDLSFDVLDQKCIFAISHRFSCKHSTTFHRFPHQGTGTNEMLSCPKRYNAKVLEVTWPLHILTHKLYKRYELHKRYKNR